MQIRNFTKALALVATVVLTTSFSNGTKQMSKTLEPVSQTTMFHTDGLYYAEFYDYLYLGHFENITIKPTDMEFIMIFEQYLRAYGDQCDQYLPKNKVEIMKLVCAKEEVSTNIYGTPLGSNCIEWAYVGTNLFARPELYKAKLEVEKLQSADAIKVAMDMMSDPNAMGNSVDMLHKAKGLRNDMAQLFILNPGNSVGIKRFEANLERFALSKPAIRTEESSKYETMKTSGGPQGAQNLAKLVDDLVASQAKTWALNRYVAGSVSGLEVLQKDAKGRPTVARADYTYQAFGNTGGGWVQISFTEGLPTCLYFFDFPNNCKTPNSSIVAAYAQGDYRN